jgi:hypothetical protein
VNLAISFLAINPILNQLEEALHRGDISKIITNLNTTDAQKTQILTLLINDSIL